MPNATNGGKSHQALTGIETFAQDGLNSPREPRRGKSHQALTGIETSKLERPKWVWQWRGKSHQALTGIETLNGIHTIAPKPLVEWEKSPSPRGH